MDTLPKTLSIMGLQKFRALQSEAINTVTERFYTEHNSIYQQLGTRGREACRDDISFHLEFLYPVLQFGLLQPMVDYLCWLGSVLTTRAIPLEHLILSLDWLAEFFTQQMDYDDGLVVAAALQAARAKFLATDTTTLATPHTPEAWNGESEFETALLAGNHNAAKTIINQLIDTGHSLVDIELHIIQPALYSIGAKWQENQVSVAQEHLATAIAHAVMTEGLARSMPHDAVNKKVLLACVAGNNHAVGLRMVADSFQLAGWEVQYLGQNVPTAAILKQTAEWKPNLVGLSVSFAQHLQIVKQVIAQMNAEFGSARPAIIVGGLAINRFHKLADVVGADAYSEDAQTAVVSGTQLVSS